MSLNYFLLCLKINISFQIMNFNYEIIKKESENDKVLKIFYSPNNEPILDF